ncbi:MAG: LPXTG cell wall anchor domain-containing protein, partial [Bifidobacteriaceae bacterium]|jgi:LPXTG-motif cell wall-anchored protein|nr:LPXTG cell wall anchor domain-containing protein [Bifidobacteriaceae bacterium]
LEAARSGELGVDQVVADQVIRVLAPQGTPDPGAPGGQGTPVPGVSSSGAATAHTTGPAGAASGSPGSTGPPGVVWVAVAGALLALAAGGALSLRRRRDRSRE